MVPSAPEGAITLVDLIRQETTGSRREIIIAAGLSGFSNTVLLAIINSAVQGGAAGTRSLRYLLLFALAFGVYAISFRWTFNKVTEIVEEILLRLRVRIADKIRQADLLSLERIDQAEIFNLLTSQARLISEAAGSLSSALQSSIMLLFAALYLAIISVPAFIFCTVLLGATVPAYMRRMRGANEWIQKTSDQEVEVFSTIRDLLDGFKEVKLNENRSRDLMVDIAGEAATLRALKVKTADMFNMNYIAAYGAFYFMIAAVIFLLPRLVTLAPADMLKVMMTVLFIIGPLGTVIVGIQSLSKSNVAVSNMVLLEERLDRFMQGRHDEAGAPAAPTDFTELRMEAIAFHYVDRDGNEVFRVGPLDFAVRKGEVVFIMGGNGSGKTTFLKLLTGLYPPDSGRLLVDGVAVGPGGMRAYRARFSAIFADFYLFRKLYGLANVDAEVVQRLLVQFRLQDKTAFAGDRFTNLDLSTGQRKRLAMIVALLEDRPIYVFDEWAADQDPEFRRYFYEELIPELVARGKTIIAVTHDDRYLHAADRVVKMELGQIVSVVEQDRRVSER